MQMFQFSLKVQPNGGQSFPLIPVPPGVNLKVVGASISVPKLGMGPLPQGESGFTTGMALGYLAVGFDPSHAMAFVPVLMFSDQTEETIPGPVKLCGMRLPGMGSTIPENSWLYMNLGTNNFGDESFVVQLFVFVE